MLELRTLNLVISKSKYSLESVVGFMVEIVNLYPVNLEMKLQYNI